MEKRRFKSSISVFGGRVVVYELIKDAEVVAVEAELQNKDKECIYKFRTLHELARFLGYPLKKTRRASQREGQFTCPIVELDRPVKDWPIELYHFYAYLNKFRQHLSEQKKALIRAGVELAIQQISEGDIWDEPETPESPYGDSIEGEDLRIEEI